MLASLNWIKEFVDVVASPEEIADKLSMAGLEIEAAKSLGDGLDLIYTAKILEIDKHPNADRLSLCQVQCGDEQVSVVCGAKNMQAGDVVALAQVGAKLPNGLKIKKSKIRQVESHGMLCSESELGFAAESEGILILPQDTPHGLSIVSALALEDTIFEVNVTPNRGDCLSMRGLAREVAANFGHSFQAKSTAFKVDMAAKLPKVAVDLQSLEQCTRYTCRTLNGIQVKASPQWLQQRLESCGIRAINNVVDATNYVMLETGQPLHAFDLEQVKGKQIIIRQAEAGEVIETLDGETRRLQTNDLVIADAERILALAGVMGGKDSGIETTTVDLLLESACFDPSTVRKTARRLALQTESSYRFERGVDPNASVMALDRLSELLIQLSESGSCGEVVDVYSQPVQPLSVTLRTEQIKRVLGVELTAEQILPPLQGLGIEGKESPAGQYQLKIPTFRSDLTREIDLIEEVARLYGYNNIPVSFPEISIAELASMPSSELAVLDRLRALLLGWGFTEALHYSFTSEALLEKFGFRQDARLQLLNPISEDLSVLRPNLLPQMVQTLQSNIFKGIKDLRFFEIRPVYQIDPNGSSSFQERWHLCLGMSGDRRPLHFLEKDEIHSAEEFKGLTLLALKGYLQALLKGWFPEAQLLAHPLDHAYFHPKRQVLLHAQLDGSRGESVELGMLGRLHPQILADLDVAVPILVAEINLDLFLTESKNSIQFEEISPFPTIWRDLNLIVDEGTSNGQVLEVIRAQGGSWLRRVELYDIYRGKPLDSGKKALTYRIEYGAQDRTLTDEEVNQAREKLLAKLKDKIGATLR